MEYALLRSLRALGPGLIILSYADLFLLFALAKPAYFWGLDSAKLFLIGYVVGGAYGALTSHINRDHHAFQGVTDSTLKALQEFVPEVRGRTWLDVSPCFYKLIDTDKSLEQKSKGIYFNGFIVTTSFEAIWISLVASVLGAGLAFYKDEWKYLVVAVVAAAVAYLVWRASIKRHCELAKGQVNVIRKRFAQEFRACVGGYPQQEVGKT